MVRRQITVAVEVSFMVATIRAPRHRGVDRLVRPTNRSSGRVAGMAIDFHTDARARSTPDAHPSFRRRRDQAGRGGAGGSRPRRRDRRAARRTWSNREADRDAQGRDRGGRLAPAHAAGMGWYGPRACRARHGAGRGRPPSRTTDRGCSTVRLPTRATCTRCCTRGTWTSRRRSTSGHARRQGPSGRASP